MNSPLTIGIVSFPELNSYLDIMSYISQIKNYSTIVGSYSNTTFETNLLKDLTISNIIVQNAIWVQICGVLLDDILTRINNILKIKKSNVTSLTEADFSKNYKILEKHLELACTIINISIIALKTFGIFVSEPQSSYEPKNLKSFGLNSNFEYVSDQFNIKNFPTDEFGNVWKSYITRTVTSETSGFLIKEIQKINKTLGSMG